VIQPPSEGWFGSEGEFEFTTPVGSRVQCWYLPAQDGVTPDKVKLSNEAVNRLGYWIGAVWLSLVCLAFLVGGVYISAASCESCKSKWEQLEEADECRAQLNKRVLLRVESRAGRLVGARAIHRSSSHLFSEPSDWYAGTHEAEIRNGFLRKVYGIVAIQVSLTATVAVLFMYYAPLADLVLGGGSTGACRIGGPTGATVYCAAWFVYLLNGVMILTLLACYMFKDEYPLNYLCLIAFTLTESLVVGIVCCVYRAVGYEDLIVQALILAVVIFGCLTVWTMQSRIKFDFLLVPILMCLLLIIIAGILAHIFHSPLLYTVYAYCGAVVFMLYIVYDTYMITNRLGYDDYIVAAIELYLDIINLFLYILRFLASSRG